MTLQYSENATEKPHIGFVIEPNQRKNVGAIEVIARRPVLLPPLPFTLVPRPYVQWLMRVIPPGKVALVAFGGRNRPDFAQQDGYVTDSISQSSACTSASLALPTTQYMHSSVRWQWPEQPSVDQYLEMTRYARSQRVVTNEQPYLDIAVEGSLGEVRRGYKDRLIINNKRLWREERPSHHLNQGLGDRSTHLAVMCPASRFPRSDPQTSEPGGRQLSYRLFCAGCSAAM
jgi:hypothetical protein